METLAGVKVLIVEDEVLTLDLFEFALTAQKAEVRTARNVPEAMEQMQNWTPQMIVTDIGLPDMDGYAFINLLRAQAATKSIPVIVLSGYISGRQQITDDDLVTKISKPVDPDHLIRLIEERIRK
jgi:CheY-like chemotaxis protein